MSDFDHLEAIEQRLGRERDRLASARTDADRAFREREVTAAVRERDAEIAFLERKGVIPALNVADLLLSDDELLTDLAPLPADIAELHDLLSAAGDAA